MTDTEGYSTWINSTRTLRSVIAKKECGFGLKFSDKFLRKESKKCNEAIIEI